jgi:hypothetical protein
MPQVPYKPFPTAEPAINPAPSIGLSVPGAAFGTNIAEAEKGLGQSVEQVSNEAAKQVLSWQALQNETDARNKDADFMIAVGEKHARFSALEGQNAVDAFPAYEKDLKDTYQTYRGQLSNPAAQRLFDGAATSTLSRTIFNGAGHRAAQAKQALDGSIDSQIKANLATITNDTDEGTFTQANNRIRSLMEQKARIKGWTPEQTAEATREMTQTLIESRVTNKSRIDSAGAREILEANRGFLDGKTADKLENTVSIGEAKQGAKKIADFVTKTMTAESSTGELGTMMEMGDKLADETSPNNVDMKWNIKSLIKSKYDQLQAIARDNTRGEQKTVGDWIQQNNIKDINLINSDPTVHDAYLKLSDKDRRAMDANINHNAKMDGDLETPAKTARFQQLSGMPGNGRVKEFNEVNLDGEMDLTTAQRKTLKATQAKTRKDETVDPHVTRVLADPNVKSMLRNSSILDSDDKPVSHEVYDRLSGIVKAKVENFFEQNGKWPKPEEEHKMAAEALRMQATYHRWWGGNTSGSIVQEGIPDQVRKVITESLTKDLGEEPTEEQVIKKVLQLQNAAKATPK